jgi:hypothetical protein
MISLRVVGALDRCKTLPSDLVLEEVANMHVPDNLVIPQQNLRALERLGTEPELVRALAEALDKNPGTNKTGVERVESLQQRLSLAHKKLERTHARLEASRTRSRELARRNRLLIARYSVRRYRLADAFASIALRIPGIGKLVGRKSTADNR